MPYLYETHLHTSPASRCARADVRDTLEFYKSLDYAGVFITNHFIDGNIGCDSSLSYEERIEFFFADYEEGVRIGRELGIDVFPGLESSYYGTDFLIYGLDKAWFLAHPESEHWPLKLRLERMAAAGALIIHAHPYAEAAHVDHIRLFPRHVHGVEVYNAARSPLANSMAEHYAENYHLIPFAGSDNHTAARRRFLGGMQSDTPIRDVADFIERVKNGQMELFRKELN